MKKIVYFLFSVGIFLFLCGDGISFAGEVDILVKKLVEKGILSKNEANQLLEEIRIEAEREKEEIKQAAIEAAEKRAKGGVVGLPKWVEKMKFKGDLRARYQHLERNNDTLPGIPRDRGRVRLRVGVESQVNENWKAGFGIASGGDDPRSTNETLDDTFESPDLRIDYAYGQYQPVKGLKIFGGKFKNPLYRSKDLLWDGDIRPDGLATGFDYKDIPNLTIFGTAGFFILEEFGGDVNDPYMLAIQPGIHWKFKDNGYLKLAGSVYEFTRVKGNDFTAGGAFGAGTNSQDPTTGAYLNDHDALAVDAEIGFTKFPGPVPYFAVFGQYVNSEADDLTNPSGSDEDEGYLIGFKFGHQKVKAFGQWQAKYNYRRLERDAWPDFLPDSDFYGGGTNAKGYELEFSLGLHKNVNLGLDYINSEPIQLPAGATDREEEILQVDLILKW